MKKYYINEIKKTINKRGYFYFISFMLMASTFLPIVFNNLPPIIRSHHIWTPVWFFSLIIFYPRIFKDRLIIIVLSYGLIFVLILPNILWAKLDEWSKVQLTTEFYEIILAISVITYFRIEQDFFRLAKLVKWSMIFIFITAVMSIVTSLIDLLYARNLLQVSSIKFQSKVESILSYKKYGGGNYGFTGALLCVFPMLIYYFKNNWKFTFDKKYIVIFGIVIFLALLRMQIFASILIALFIIIFSAMGSKNTKIIYLILSLTIIVLFVIPAQLYADTLITASTWFPRDSEVYYKLNETAKFLILGDNEYTEIGIRAERYPLLIKSFIANPLLGNFFSDRPIDISAGAHIYWMYKLGAYGILGAIPFFYIIYSFIKGSIKYFDKDFVFYFILSTFSIIVLGLMKALSGREMWYTFFIIVPGLYYLPLLKKSDKQFKKKDHSIIN